MYIDINHFKDILKSEINQLHIPNKLINIHIHIHILVFSDKTTFEILHER